MNSARSSNGARFLGSDVFHRSILLFVDSTALLLSHLGAVRLIKSWHKLAVQCPNAYTSTIVLSVSIVLLALMFGAYDVRQLRRPDVELERVCVGWLNAFAGIAAISILLDKRTLLQSTFLFFALALPAVLFGRFCIRGLYSRLWNRGYARKRALFVGEPAALDALQQRFKVLHYRGYDLIGTIQSHGNADHLAPGAVRVRVLGTIDDWRDVVMRTQPEIVIADWSLEQALLGDIVRACSQNGVDVDLCSELLGAAAMQAEVDPCIGSVRLRASSRCSRKVQHVFKWLIDCAIGLIGSAATLLLTPFIWLLIKLDDGGPLFHSREFVGCDGKIGYYLKFRTMVQNADEVLRGNPQLWQEFCANHKLKNDPRLLHVGPLLRKFSIDEFPQFFSVLSGRLTFVGPRVISAAETARYGDFLPKRLTVRPGLTGYWQVMGRQTTTYDERIAMDMFYVDNWSIWLDLTIIAKTFFKFFAQEGAY